MLKRISSSLFQVTTGSQVQIVARSRDNNGVNSAMFRYAQNDLPRLTIQGLPGCSFAALPSQRSFTALVVFDPGGKTSARYDLFEIDTDGTMSDLSEDTFPDADPDISFSIEGIAPPPGVIMAVEAAPAATTARAKKKTPLKKKKPSKNRSAQ